MLDLITVNDTTAYEPSAIGAELQLVPCLAYLPCRIVMTDHGAFVLLNVYAPNAGDRPARARLPYKLRFLEALKEKMDLLHGQGREVRLHQTSGMYYRLSYPMSPWLC